MCRLQLQSELSCESLAGPREGYGWSVPRFGVQLASGEGITPVVTETACVAPRRRRLRLFLGLALFELHFVYVKQNCARLVYLLRFSCIHW